MSPADPLSAALDRIMTRYGRMLRSVGRRRGLDDADLDELDQEVRVRLWRALAEREKIEAVRASYVYGAARSAALDMIRRRRARPARSLERSNAAEAGTAARARPASGTADPPDVKLERRELGERIDRAVSALREPRDVVVRLHLSGYDRYEIADLLGWTEPKVRNLLYRGLADLRASLRSGGIGPEGVE